MTEYSQRVAKLLDLRRDKLQEAKRTVYTQVLMLVLASTAWDINVETASFLA